MMQAGMARSVVLIEQLGLAAVLLHVASTTGSGDAVCEEKSNEPTSFVFLKAS